MVQWPTNGCNATGGGSEWLRAGPEASDWAAGILQPSNRPGGEGEGFINHDLGLWIRGDDANDRVDAEPCFVELTAGGALNVSDVLAARGLPLRKLRRLPHSWRRPLAI